jgi:hypothetical protein
MYVRGIKRLYILSAEYETPREARLATLYQHMTKAHVRCEGRHVLAVGLHPPSASEARRIAALVLGEAEPAPESVPGASPPSGVAGRHGWQPIGPCRPGSLGAFTVAVRQGSTGATIIGYRFTSASHAEATFASLEPSWACERDGVQALCVHVEGNRGAGDQILELLRLNQ